MHLPQLLQNRFASALADLTDDPQKYAGMIRGTTDPKFGDYQANCAMPLSKTSSGSGNPRDMAASIVEALDIGDLCEPADIAGPGFINLKLKDSVITDSIASMLTDQRCLIQPVSDPKNIVIDFSSCLLYTSPSPRDQRGSRMPSSA